LWYDKGEIILSKGEMLNDTNPGRTLFNQIILITVLVVGIMIFGTIGYMIIEDMSLEDALFLTSITVSTVGYGFPGGVSSAGHIFTMILIAFGVSIVLYGVSSITGTVVEGRLGLLMKIRRNRKMIEKLKKHVIVVGAGKTARYVVLELIKQNRNFVVVDENQETIDKMKELMENDFPYVLGDATEEDTLIKAGIENAGSIITTLPTDSLNVYVVLSARTLNSGLNIISKASEVNASNKLVYAGASSVVADAQITGIRMARIATKPDKVNFLDVMAFGNQEFRIEEVKVSEKSPVVNKTLMELGLSKTMRVMIIAIRRGDDTIFGPTGETRILPNDSLMVLGSRKGLSNITDYVNQ